MLTWEAVLQQHKQLSQSPFRGSEADNAVDTRALTLHCLSFLLCDLQRFWRIFSLPDALNTASVILMTFSFMVGYNQSSLYEGSHYETLLMRTSIMKDVFLAWSRLAHPNFYEQNRTRDNENANKGHSVAQSVSETRGSTWVSSLYALIWCEFCARFCCFFKRVLWFIPC